MKNLKLIWNYMKGNRLIYLGAIISIGIATILNIFGPLVIKVTIDSIIGNEPLPENRWIILLIDHLGGIEVLRSRLWMIMITLVILASLNGIFLYLKGKWSAVAAEATAENMRAKLYDHIQHLPYEYHVKVETGELIQKCTSDVDTIRRFLAIQFVEIGSAFFMLLFMTYTMISLDLRMTIISLISIPIIFSFAIIFFMKVKEAFYLSDESEAIMSTVLQENLTGVRVVRAFARQSYEIDKFEGKNSEHRDLTYRLIKLLAWYWGSSDFVCFIQIGLVLILGSYWAAYGLLTLGTLVVFITYEGMLLWPVRQMGRIIADMGKAIVSLERIQGILEEPREIMEENGKQPFIKGNIEFKNVNFSYEDGRQVLDNISFKVKVGETVAILGPTGAGKTSLIHLLGRLYDYDEGSIKIDGIELRDIDRKWIRKNVGIILQEPFLFAKTIRENIRMPKPRATEEEVFSVAKTAAIHDVILNFDQGYETMVGERGVSLSGGQKQRMAIARTLLIDSPIVVFDDSLSAVDTETDSAIRLALKNRKKKATTFIISHRITTLSEADFILVLDKGKIVQKGTHEELVQQKGIYRRIWEIQNNMEKNKSTREKIKGDIILN